jgi:hypothetical protein
MYCPNCGLAVLGTNRAAVDEYVQAKVDRQVAEKMADEASLARGIADRAEERSSHKPWKSIKPIPTFPPPRRRRDHPQNQPVKGYAF